MMYIKSAPRSRASSLSLSEMWLLMAAIIFICGFVGYVIYDAIMATASELLQRLLVISPLLLVIAVHWLSTGSHFNLPIPGLPCLALSPKAKLKKVLDELLNLPKCIMSFPAVFNVNRKVGDELSNLQNAIGFFL
ncbi:hypothetical protein CMV_010074 [Castanea mollissima]|uniref:Uncharacterized protein n=1 Tax=Castanea mollissima TaxID=60419 RepID=A0A8J4RIW2_9ROSI|nr:hypothetical protein CMV_010074 [Castanea mollissima]